MKRATFLGLLLLAAIAITFVSTRVRITSTGAPKPFLLSDGSVLIFHGATYGTNHIAPEKFVGLLRLVPKPLRKLFGPSASSATPTANPVAIFWFNRLGANVGRDWRLTVATRDGFE